MPDASDVQRVFLGWSAPALPAAAAWLIDTLGGESADLGGVTIVVPGRRAQRRLFELLAERAAGSALVPPAILTLGELPGRLLGEDAAPAAGDLESLVVRASVLRDADESMMRAFAPHPPGRDDWPGWWSLAEQLQRAADELGAQLMLLSDVPQRSKRYGDEPRWAAVAELDRRYHDRLAHLGRKDKHAARRDAAAEGSCAIDGHLVLLATADLMPMHRAMLEAVDAPVTALIFAPDGLADGFDAFGGMIESYWSDRAVAFDDAALAFVDRPSDQAVAVLDAIREWSRDRPVAADEVTVGLGDPSLAGPVGRTLELAGLAVRSAAGRPSAQARPAALLLALADFADGLRFDKLAALLRHPDAEEHLALDAGGPADDWLTLLDRYATDHLAARPAGGWLGDEQRAKKLDAVYRAALSLLPDPPAAVRPLHTWADAIGGALEQVYGRRRLHRHAPDDRPVVITLEQIGTQLEQLAALDPSLSPYCTFAHAARLVVSRLAGQSVPEPGGDPAIELAGYLELLLDDAPNLAIVGMNEGQVPQPPVVGALLPEGVRADLQLPGDSHRLARDGYALSAVLASRRAVKLVAGRRSLGGDPLLPSRLLMKDRDAALVRRVSGFVDHQGETHETPVLITPGKHDRFLIPVPVVPAEPITSLRVTAFRDYLACPYRFYLKHVCKLDVIDDSAMELTGAQFGTLAHDALRILAGEDVAALDNADAVAERLSMALDRRFAQMLGQDPPIAARVQAEQLRYRLTRFAEVHADLVRAGWRIVQHERSLEAEVTVDGEPFRITGQVDRVDRHADGGYRVLDYKTTDSAKKPEQTHRRVIDGVRQWVDLQLPIYLDLCGRFVPTGRAELGYLNLPKKAEDTGFVPAGWSADDLESARQARDFVIRQVRAGVFWPPKLEVPRFDDGLGALCADRAADRPRLIRASAAMAGEASGG